MTITMDTFLKGATVAQVLDCPAGRERKAHFLAGVEGSAGPVCLDSALSASDAALLLAQHAISSAPIYDKATASFIGLLDYQDFVAFVLTVFHKHPQSPSFNANVDFKTVLHQGLAAGSSAPIKHLANLSNKNPMYVIQTTASLWEAVSELVSTKAHRLIVLDAGVFVGVLSATSIMEYVADYFGRFGTHANTVPAHSWPTGSKTLAELSLVQGKVISVLPEDPLLNALKGMHDHGISSIAMVKDGKLYGAISMSDVKSVFGPHGRWNHIYDSCISFFSSVRLQQGIDNEGRDKAPLFTCTPDLTLLAAAEKLAGIRAHRLWILETSDPSSQVLGVLSLSDVLPWLLK